MALSFNFFRTDISEHVTAHDLLKTLALVLMIIDHVGYFFLNGTEEFRMIGRLSAPIWLFLIGFSHNRKSEIRIWIWAIILLAGFAYMRGGQGIIPVNILFLFLFIRATLDFVMQKAAKDFDKLFGIFWLMALLAIPSMYFVEYGTVGYLFAMIGYMARNQEMLRELKPKDIYIFTGLTTILYCAFMWYEFNFDPINAVFMSVMLLCISFSLLHFERKEFESNNTLLNLIKYPIFITGRRTLEFYVLHLLIFMYIVIYGFNPSSIF